MATHSGGRSKTAENQVVREKHRPSLAMACQPRPSLALLYLPQNLWITLFMKLGDQAVSRANTGLQGLFKKYLR
ncbi:hypothetical protein FT688_22145 [Aeromonas hydrophila]|nr:hypothetical protein FT688_22145 [Aeromonas hydrophila]